ncbi:NAD(P)H-binding protein [Streptoalloteichus hindustanus]|uniref:Nucleoside-diphosphate-sugar epimerase n=1 Tax=Streptoalloteichus hindustanus TaxID=2017 RepID=A0A1M4V782_STRHI|nr:NAD(P)H-binding protein [Streptoalloteichus hindustanus]SHE64809.1 Nucleoside-diphosphate-sugar epimerase [Streptoalloteichus hindustanus]
MRVVIAGGHGKIALRLERLLAERGDVAVGMVRDPDQAGDLHAAGADAVVCDLEAASVNEVAAHLAGADAVVFAAGAGPGSGAARKDTVDRAAAVLVADACHVAEVRRYLLVSAMGLDRAERPGVDEVFAAYLRAKAAAEEDLRGRDLDWTVLRPGRLTDEPGTGRVRLGASVPPGEVTRDDVASVLVALLDEPRSAQLTLELVGGDVPVGEAVSAALT